MSTDNNKPAETIRDGAIKATIWKNQGEKGAFYSVRIARTWKDEHGQYHDRTDYSGTELLIVSRVALMAYTKVSAMRQADRMENGGAQ